MSAVLGKVGQECAGASVASPATVKHKGAVADFTVRIFVLYCKIGDFCRSWSECLRLSHEKPMITGK
jgi:hypothetical protein